MAKRAVNYEDVKCKCGEAISKEELAIRFAMVHDIIKKRMDGNACAKCGETANLKNNSCGHAICSRCLQEYPLLTIILIGNSRRAIRTVL